jgi:hypothetical protein
MEKRDRGINEKGIFGDKATNYIIPRLEEEEADSDDRQLTTAVNGYFEGYGSHPEKQSGTEEEDSGVTASVSISLCSRHFWLAVEDGRRDSLKAFCFNLGSGAQMVYTGTL